MSISTRPNLSPRVTARLRGAAWLLAFAALALAVGALAVRQPVVGLGVAALALGAGVTMAEPAMIPVVAMPVMLVTARVSGGGTDLSFSDLALFLATWPAALLGGRPYTPAMRRLLWAVCTYEALTFFSVLSNPNQVGAVEWAHQLFLLAGSMLVGWAVGRRGLARVGFSLVALVASAIAVDALATAAVNLAHGVLAPAYITWPFSMQKNAVGTILGIVTCALFARPPWLRWPRRLVTATILLLVAGTIVAWSRQAVVGLLVVALVVAIRDPRRRTAGWMAIMAGLGGVAVIAFVNDQLSSQNIHNSANTRIQAFSDAVAVWQHGPWFGAGNRWWYTGKYQGIQPPNAELEVLTTTGIVGLAAFLALMIALLVTLWRLPPEYGLFGFAAVLSRLVQGQFDIFWLTVESSVPFLLAGLAIGALEFDRPTVGTQSLDQRRSHAPSVAGQ